MKRDGKSVGNFNISVAATDAFMEAVKKGLPSRSTIPTARRSSTARNARKVFRMIVESAWAIGDPAHLHRPHQPVQSHPGMGLIDATNPAARQPLHATNPAIGLDQRGQLLRPGRLRTSSIGERFARRSRWPYVFSTMSSSVNKYPLPEIDAVQRATVRIGLGSWLGRPAHPDEDPLRLARSPGRGRQAGGLPAGQGRRGLGKAGPDPGQLPNIAKSVYKGRKMRNATVFTVAPTGTISRIAGCSSSIDARLRFRVRQPHHRFKPPGRPPLFR